MQSNECASRRQAGSLEPTGPYVPPAEHRPVEDHGCFDGVDLNTLAERVGTPFHAYSASAIRQRINALHACLRGLDAQVCFAAKANSNGAVLALMHEAGVGADIVSAGELRRSLRAGIPPSRIVFSGVGKTANEITEALAAGIARFNVESFQELELLQQIAFARGVVACAAVRINPDVDARTHQKISTGKAGDKFGVSVAEARKWFADSARLTHVRLDGLHIHIGSQILTIEPFRLALQRLAAFWRELTGAGHAINSIDVGGGLGVCYRPDQERPIPLAGYVDTIRAELSGFHGRLVLEPGRWLVAEAGILVTRVIRVKPGDPRSFLVIDAAMNDLARPSLYDAWHEVLALSASPGPCVAYDIVGPVCESGDTLAQARDLPQCEAGDLLLIAGTGAYGASMASTYNSRPLAAEVMLDCGRYSVVRRRQTFDEMIAGEQPAEEWQCA